MILTFIQIQALRYIASPDGLKSNFDKVMGHEVIHAGNLHGINGKISFNKYKSFYNALFGKFLIFY